MRLCDSAENPYNFFPLRNHSNEQQITSRIESNSRISLKIQINSLAWHDSAVTEQQKNIEFLFNNKTRKFQIFQSSNTFMLN